MSRTSAACKPAAGANAPPLEVRGAQGSTLLSKLPNVSYLARGSAATNGGGRIHYEPSRCVFLYRLP